jgi:hypothetical protein
MSNEETIILKVKIYGNYAIEKAGTGADFSAEMVYPNSPKELFFSAGENIKLKDKAITVEGVEFDYAREFNYIKLINDGSGYYSANFNPTAKIDGYVDGDFDISVAEMVNGDTSTLSINMDKWEFKADKLKLLGRNHTSKMALKAIDIAKTLLDNISIDLIYNVNKKDKTIMIHDIEIVKDLNLSHLSIYSLTIESGTKLHAQNYKPYEDEEMTKVLFEKVEQIGLKQYEISNFGRVSTHNHGYWEYQEYLGVGAGAVGRVGKNRYYPPTDIDTYIANPTLSSIEKLSDQDMIVEQILLGFRSDVGVSKELFSQSQITRLGLLEDEKIIIKTDNRYYNQNYLLADELVLFVDKQVD